MVFQSDCKVFCGKGWKSIPSFYQKQGPFCIGKASLYIGLRYVKTEIKPQHGCYLILVTFDDGIELPKVPEKPKRVIGIDPGVDNLAAVVNNFGVHPFLIKGGAVKAANQRFNKNGLRFFCGNYRIRQSAFGQEQSFLICVKPKTG